MDISKVWHSTETSITGQYAALPYPLIIHRTPAVRTSFQRSCIVSDNREPALRPVAFTRGQSAALPFPRPNDKISAAFGIQMYFSTPANFAEIVIFTAATTSGQCAACGSAMSPLHPSGIGGYLSAAIGGLIEHPAMYGVCSSEFKGTKRGFAAPPQHHVG